MAIQGINFNFYSDNLYSKIIYKILAISAVELLISGFRGDKTTARKMLKR